MSDSKDAGRDFAGLNTRFRPRNDLGTSGSGFLYKPESVRNTGRVLNNRVHSKLRTSVPKMAVLVFGLLLTIWGVINSAGILSLRGSQNSLVNNLLLVFFGAFLVFLSLHDGHVEKAHRSAL